MSDDEQPQIPEIEIKTELTVIEADPVRKKVKWSAYENIEDGSVPDYDAVELEDTAEADTYKVYHHKHYEAPGPLAWSVITVLEFLKGRPWDRCALNYVHALRPSAIRVSVGGGGTLDAVTWRVTVALEKDERTIHNITQEVQVGNVGSKHGHGLSKYLRGESPEPARGYYNAKGLEKLEIYAAKQAAEDAPE